jgi:hypothetical protein
VGEDDGVVEAGLLGVGNRHGEELRAGGGKEGEETTVEKSERRRCWPRELLVPVRHFLLSVCAPQVRGKARRRGERGTREGERRERVGEREKDREGRTNS